MDIHYLNLFEKGYNYGVLKKPTVIEVSDDIVYLFPTARSNGRNKLTPKKPETKVITSEISFEKVNNIRDIMAK